jgi:hypothetical protein
MESASLAHGEKLQLRGNKNWPFGRLFHLDQRVIKSITDYESHSVIEIHSRLLSLPISLSSVSQQLSN